MLPSSALFTVDPLPLHEIFLFVFVYFFANRPLDFLFYSDFALFREISGNLFRLFFTDGERLVFVSRTNLIKLFFTILNVMLKCLPFYCVLSLLQVTTQSDGGF